MRLMTAPCAWPYSALKLLRSTRSEEHTSELQSRGHLVCRLLLAKKNVSLPGHVLGVREQRMDASVLDGGRGLAERERRHAGAVELPHRPRRLRHDGRRRLVRAAR